MSTLRDLAAAVVYAPTGTDEETMHQRFIALERAVINASDNDPLTEAARWFLEREYIYRSGDFGYDEDEDDAFDLYCDALHQLKMYIGELPHDH